MTTNLKLLEIFVDYIESDVTCRDYWIEKIRKLGLDEALAEFEECKSLIIKTYKSNCILLSHIENEFRV